MKKFLLIVLAALFILVPVSVYAYENISDRGFDWNMHSSMHESHHNQFDEWIDEAVEKGELSEEEAPLYREHHEKMNDYSKSRRYGCH